MTAPDLPVALEGRLLRLECLVDELLRRTHSHSDNIPVDEA